MPKRSKIAQLPAEVKSWLDRELIDGNFSGYEAIKAELKKRGFTLGKSSIHRYGAALEEKLEAIKASTTAARQIADAAPDDADLRSAAVISLVQTEVFDLLVELKQAEKEADPARRIKLLSAVAGNIAKLSRASVNQKKWEQEIRSKVQAVADRATKIGKKRGLSAAGVEEIKREILGIAK